MEEKLNSKITGDAFRWERLSQLDPGEVCNRSGALYDPARKGFLLDVYHLNYLVDPGAKIILRRERTGQFVGEELHPFFTLMVLVYLTELKEGNPSPCQSGDRGSKTGPEDGESTRPPQRWLTEKDLKGGSFFFRGPHSLQVKPLEDLYGRDPAGFLRAGGDLGGTKLPYADNAFALKVFPRISLAYLLWKGNEEFPPRIRVLFDSNVQSFLPLDIIWAMVDETTRRLARQATL